LASLKLPIKTSTANTVDAEVDAETENLLAKAAYIFSNPEEFLAGGEGSVLAETDAIAA
jgi:hypothetical protein